MRGMLALIALFTVAVSSCVVSAQAALPYISDGVWGGVGFVNNYGLALDASGRAYVADSNGHRVVRCRTNMTYLSQWGTNGSADGQFDYPYGIAVSGENKVYVSDGGSASNNRVQIFSLAGSFLDKVGGYGRSNGQFDGPRGICSDADHNIYIADAGNHRVQKFDKDGGYLTSWGSYGDGNNFFASPSAVAWGAGGYLFVADSSNNRVVKYTSTGTFVDKWGSIGAANGQVWGPMGVAVGKDNMVYVSDTNNHRLQKFDANGNWKVTWGEWGSGNGQLSGPVGIAVGQDLKVWVTEVGNGRVQRFRPNRAPTAPTSVLIVPDVVTDDVDMQVVADGSTDPDGDTISYRYQWWKSPEGTTWTKGPNTKVVASGLTTVGQYWKVEAWAYDGVVRSAKVMSEVEQISDNTPPTAPTKVAITPTNPTDGSKLTATASGATDADGDTLTYRYQWYKSTDGTTWVKGQAQRYVGAAATTVGEFWKCQARAYDGTVTGPARTSAAVEIGVGTGSALAVTATALDGDTAQIVVSLSAPASVQVTIRNMAGIVVGELPARDLAAGISTLTWNGRGSAGAKVPGGAYLVRVTALAPGGGQASALAPLQRQR